MLKKYWKWACAALGILALLYLSALIWRMRAFNELEVIFTLIENAKTKEQEAEAFRLYRVWRMRVWNAYLIQTLNEWRLMKTPNCNWYLESESGQRLDNLVGYNHIEELRITPFYIVFESGYVPFSKPSMIQKRIRKKMISVESLNVLYLP